MKKKIQIIISGKTYPCRPTMGAMLRFHQITGREVTDISPDSVSDLLTYLYCCVASASKADGIPFEMELMDFADAIAPEEMNEWVANAAKNGGDGNADGSGDGGHPTKGGKVGNG